MDITIERRINEPRDLAAREHDYTKLRSYPGRDFGACCGDRSTGWKPCQQRVFFRIEFRSLVPRPHGTMHQEDF